MDPKHKAVKAEGAKSGAAVKADAALLEGPLRGDLGIRSLHFDENGSPLQLLKQLRYKLTPPALAALGLGYAKIIEQKGPAS